MEESFGSRHDDTVYYISENLKDIIEQNVNKLQRLCCFYAVIYFLFLLYAYVMIDSFQIHVSYFLVPLFICAVWKATDIFQHCEGVKFGAVRALAFVLFLGMTGLVAVVDAQTYPDSPMILVPLFINTISSFYIDYFFVVMALEASAIVLSLFVSFFIRGGETLAEASCLCLAAFSVSIYAYWLALCERANYANDKWTLKDEGSKDLLTGLLNKVSFEREVKAYLDGREEDGQGVLLIIDFDNFKRVNDNFGHLVGDEILKKFGQILKKNFRVSDIIGRIGGDEFMVLMTGFVPEEIIDIRCSTVERELKGSHIGEAGGFSCSIGVAVDKARFSFEELYLFADDALYQAKEKGKATFVKRDANPGEKLPEHKD